jgi:PAS domain S-box-containing protein
MSKLKILIIEDNKYDLELILRELKKNNINFEYRNVYKFEDVKKEISENPPDIIFSDYQLQSFNGVEVLKYRNEHAPFTPFIKITGTLDEERAVGIIKSGADDYILKQNLSRLGPAVISAIEKMHLNRQKNYAERKLKESEEKFSKIFHFSPVPAVIINYDSGLIMDVNEEFCKFLGYKESEAIGSYIYDFEFISEINYESQIKPQLNETYFIKNIELEIRNKSDEKKFVLANFLKIILDDIKYIIIKFVDITQQKIIEKELSKAKERAEEMNKLKTIFLTNLSHEFRTPLNGILGFSDMLANEIKSPEHKSYVEAIQISGQRLLDTFNDLIDLSVIESGKIQLKLEAVNLVNTTRKVFEKFRNNLTKNLELFIDIKSENLMCKIDIAAYEKIIYKLLDNAVKFTHKGYVKLSLNKVIKDDVQYINISVEDSGIGISAEDLEIIFDRFRQSSEGLKRNYEGTGIGLSIAKRFVELLGGEIQVTSRLGEGSKFTISLPCLRAGIQNNGLNGSANSNIILFHRDHEQNNEYDWSIFKAKEKNILVVEDNDVDCFYINKLLSPHFKVKMIKDSFKAKDYYNTNKCDLIILDIHFTTGINGIELMKDIKATEANKSTPVIASTAMAMAGDRENLLQEGFDEYIQKPFDKKGLYKVLKKHLKV